MISDRRIYGSSGRGPPGAVAMMLVEKALIDECQSTAVTESTVTEFPSIIFQWYLIIYHLSLIHI